LHKSFQRFQQWLRVNIVKTLSILKFLAALADSPHLARKRSLECPHDLKQPAKYDKIWGYLISFIRSLHENQPAFGRGLPLHFIIDQLSTETHCE
jgi:hypothetical protein